MERKTIKYAWNISYGMRTAITVIMIFLIAVVLIAGCTKGNVTSHAVVKIGSDLKQSDSNATGKADNSGAAANGCSPDAGKIFGTDNPTL